MKSNFKIINGFKINYTDYCKSGFLPIVLIHPFPFDQTIWNEQAEYLINNCSYPDNKIRVITYDLSGFGKSETGDGEYSIDGWVNELLNLLDQLSIYKIVIGGMELGGFIALRFAERFPKRIAGLILCSTTARNDSPKQKEKKYDTIKEIQKNGVEGYSEKLTSKLLFPETIIRKSKTFSYLKSIVNRTDFLSLSGSLLAMSNRQDQTQNLSKIEVPVIILCGDNDDPITINDSKFMFSAIPLAELHIIPESACLINVDNTSVFNKILGNFIEKLYNKISIKTHVDALIDN